MLTRRIDHAQISDWRRQRAVRLRALGDTPDAFGVLLADELKLQDEDWMARIGKTDRATFLAVMDDRDVGMIVIAPYDCDAGLYGMWVAPEARGQGVGDSLIAAGLNWARSRGFRRIFLGVGDFNRPAIKLYERHGFEPTGVTGTLPPPRTHVLEHTRMLILD